MNGGTCLHETPSKRLPSGRKKNVRCNRSSLLTNSLPYQEGQVIGKHRIAATRSTRSVATGMTITGDQASARRSDNN